MVDSKCQELVGLLAKARSHTHGQAEGRGMSVRDAVLYRREAEQYLGPDDHLYRIDWVRCIFTFQTFIFLAFAAGFSLREERAMGF